MSIEQALVELTAAVTRNNELLEIVTSTASKNLAKTADKPAATPAPAEEEAPKRTRTTKPAAEVPAKTTKPVKAPTAQEMATATTGFLEVEDEDEYSARRGLVKKIIDKFGAKKMSEIADGDRQAALDILAAYKAGDATGLEDDEDMA